MQNKEKWIEIKDLNKSYGHKHILKNINATIYKGDRIAILGSNGSGKTTFVETISKIRKPSSGEIIYEPGFRLGIQFQDSDYPMGVNVKALINFYLQRYSNGKQSIEEVQKEKENIERLLKIFRLDKFMKKQLFQMSGGQKQRLNIMLALIHKPNFIILDELSTGLDIKIKTELRHYINDYLKDNPETSMILITHSMGEAEEMANKVWVLNWGELTLQEELSNIQKQHGSLSKFADELFAKMYEEDIKQGIEGE